MWINIVQNETVSSLVNTDHIVRVETTNAIGGLQPSGKTLRIYMMDGKEIQIAGRLRERVEKVLAQLITAPEEEIKDQESPVG